MNIINLINSDKLENHWWLNICKVKRLSVYLADQMLSVFKRVETCKYKHYAHCIWYTEKAPSYVLPPMQVIISLWFVIQKGKKRPLEEFPFCLTILLKKNSLKHAFIFYNKHISTYTDDLFQSTLSNLCKNQLPLLRVNKNTIIVSNTVAISAWVIPMWKFYFIETWLNRINVDISMT